MEEEVQKGSAPKEQLKTAKRWARVQYWGLGVGRTVEFFFVFSHCSAFSCQDSRVPEFLLQFFSCPCFRS